MPDTATGQEKFLTVVAGISLTSLLTGIFFWMVGRFQLANFVRFIPYPVIGGFLAGTGWLLVWGSFGVMVDMQPSWVTLPEFFHADTFLRWLPGMLFAVLILVLISRYSHFLLLPGMLVGVILVFYLILWLSNMSIGEAGNRGWLLGAFPDGSLWQPWSPSDFAHVHWPQIFMQASSVVTILLVSAISFLLNATGLELTFEQDIDSNRELQAAGIANVISGLGGGSVGYHTLSFSTLGHKMGVNSRLVGIFAAGVCGATLFLGASLLSLFPRFVLGALLMFLGLDLLYEWVYKAWFKLSKADYAIVAGILLVIGTVGFLEGVAVGVAATVIVFVMNYSRINVVRNVFSGAEYHSNFDRPSQHRRVLREKGEQIYILKLQGFIFFGTANNILVQVRQRAENAELPALRFIILDFQHVTGIDSSAVYSFVRMRQFAETHHITLIFAQQSSKICSQLSKEKLAEDGDAICRSFADLDHSLEWCEHEILAVEGILSHETGRSLPELLAETFSDATSVERFLRYFEKKLVNKGDYLMRQGTPADDLYFIESGVMSIQLDLEDGNFLRLRTRGPGTTVGEVALFRGGVRTASVLTERSGKVYRLSAEALRHMRRNDPDVFADFQQFVLHLLAERLAESSQFVQTLPA
jgi:SulP family sulfate permease